MKKEIDKPITECTAGEFRKFAIDSDYDDLYEYYCNNDDYKIWRDKEKRKYNFSYSFAQNVLIEKGYIDNKKETEKISTNSNTADILLQHMNWNKVEVKKCTMYIPVEINERLEKVYDKYGCIPKQNILYALLDIALDEFEK